MWLRRSLPTWQTSYRCFSSTAVEVSTKFDDIRTMETDPSKHTTKHLGRFYTVDPQLKKTIFHRSAMPKRFGEDTKTFAEMSILVRSPAVEVINYLNNTDYSKPVNRYVFYGEAGAGKSTQLLHLIHYGYVNNFILVHIPWPSNWFRNFKEKSNSLTKEGMLDINIDAAAWLIHFKMQNSQLLEKLNLKCSQEYVWSPREMTPAGSTLLELIEHGINRVKFATDTIAVLIEELKAQSTQGKCRTMVAIDGYNVFFHPKTHIKFDNRIPATPDKITITEPFLSITRPDWCNGVCLLVLDKHAVPPDHWESNLPKYLLHRKGFEHLDPFIPMHVDLYNDLEFDSMINYYLDRKWISKYTPEFDEDLKFISGRNGFDLRELTAPL